MDVYKVGNKFYFICSDKDIYLLNEDEKYSTKLSEDEIDNLEFRFLWLGKNVKTKFQSNDKKAVAALIDIIEDFSKMVVKEEFHGFPLASEVCHLRAYLFEHILKEQRCFYTSITVSGEQRSTGKESLIHNKRAKPGIFALHGVKSLRKWVGCPNQM